MCGGGVGGARARAPDTAGCGSVRRRAPGPHARREVGKVIASGTEARLFFRGAPRAAVGRRAAPARGERAEFAAAGPAATRAPGPPTGRRPGARHRPPPVARAPRWPGRGPFTRRPHPPSGPSPGPPRPSRAAGRSVPRIAPRWPCAARAGGGGLSFGRPPRGGERRGGCARASGPRRLACPAHRCPAPRGSSAAVTDAWARRRGAPRARTCAPPSARPRSADLLCPSSPSHPRTHGRCRPRPGSRNGRNLGSHGPSRPLTVAAAETVPLRCRRLDVTTTQVTTATSFPCDRLRARRRRAARGASKRRGAVAGAAPPRRRKRRVLRVGH